MVFDDKILESLFDSEVEFDDLDDNEYGDVDSKQIRRNREEILNSMPMNTKIYNNILYLKKKNKKLEQQVEDWKQ